MYLAYLNSLGFWVYMVSLVMSALVMYKVKRFFPGMPFLWVLAFLFGLSVIFAIVLLQTFFMIQMALWAVLVLGVTVSLVYLAARKPRGQDPEVK